MHRALVSLIGARRLAEASRMPARATAPDGPSVALTECRQGGYIGRSHPNS
jgi:hypothetical protein